MGSSVIAVPGVANLAGDELRALAAAAKSIGVPTDWLATIISFETGGSFSPAQPNHTGSSAFGLIQFLPSTAANLLGGTQADAAARGKEMGFAEQLQKMVVPYFTSFGTQFNSLQDLYLAVFYPRAMNKPSDYVIGSIPSATYTQNSGLDKDGKGFITKTDVTNAITRHYERAGGSVAVPLSWTFVVLGAVLSVAGIYLAQPYLPPELKLPAQFLTPIEKAIRMAKKKVSTFTAILPLALLGIVSFGWMLAKKS